MLAEELTSYEITEWVAFSQWERLQAEQKPNASNVPAEMPPTTTREEPEYNALIPDNLFGDGE